VRILQTLSGVHSAGSNSPEVAARVVRSLQIGDPFADLPDPGVDQRDTYEKAVGRGFGGSPTVLVDGVDVFADRRAVAGLACRVYETEQGPAGSLTLDQLRTAIGSA